jgi:hypothetical protein
MTSEELKEVIRLHRLWVLGDPSGKRANLHGADLHGADLHGANLRWADLQGADLQGANLRWADLHGADLHGANLRWADLHGANLRWAKISWRSHAIVSEILWRAADTESREMLAAYIGRKTNWCWSDWATFAHPETEWAKGELLKWVKPGDDAPAQLTTQSPGGHGSGVTLT